ncbi:MAG: DUF2283 domain-containing protein [Burkholderiales bacterium]|nr:DUF2283 domain-containing protein [Anaerolineae bacterium]
MKVTYYAQSDILHIEFSEAPIGESQNVGEWSNMTFGPDGTPRTLEILNAAARGIIVDKVQNQYVANETTDTLPLSHEEIAAGRKTRAAALRASRQTPETTQQG